MNLLSNSRTRRRWIMPVVVGTTIALSLTVPGASAQDFGSSAIEDAGRQAFYDAVSGFINAPGSSGHSLEQGIFAAQLSGLGNWVPSEEITGGNDQEPEFPDPNFDVTALLGKRDIAPGLQRWYIASKSMKRVLEVEVLLPKNPSQPAPMLYLLDGMDAPRSSQWLSKGNIQAQLADENVTVVMPTTAASSLYTDWQVVDPDKGSAMWETFIGQELPAVMESPAAGLSFNGKRGIMGLSMGAMGALRIAAFNPEVFSATAGISGCYSTLDPIGKQITRYIVEPGGSQVENMWGPIGSPEWVRHDLTLNTEGLRHVKFIYLFSSDGTITQSDIDNHIQQRSDLLELPSGAILEQGTYKCTKNLEEAMVSKGITHQVVEYQHGGVHDWKLFSSAFPKAWEHMKPTLYGLE